MLRIIFCLFLGFSSVTALAQDSKPIQLAEDAPDQHVVKKGDTLWGISGKFLKEPWRWPEIWRLNKEQIRNPHLIYPGQIVVLDLSGGQPRLKLGQAIKLEPRIYEEAAGEPIPGIPQRVIEPFLSEPLVVEEGGMANAARIVATQETRVNVGPGNVVYAIGVNPGARLWQVYRPAKPIKDPVTSEILGYEAFFLGNAKVVRNGDPATLEVLSAKQEIGRNDRLMPAAKPDVVAYAPHAPDKDIAGHIVSIYGGVGQTGEAGRGYIVTLNRGRRDGVETGHVLALYRLPRNIEMRVDDAVETRTLPEERYGLVFVFRTFERVSYALVMNADRPVMAKDTFRTP